MDAAPRHRARLRLGSNRLLMVGGSNIAFGKGWRTADFDSTLLGLVPAKGWMALRAIELAFGSVRTGF